MFDVIRTTVIALCLATAVHTQWTNDIPQKTLNAEQFSNSRLFTPIKELLALSDTAFTTLSHPAFPQHGVRIKKTGFCDETVQAYTGYIDIEARHFFFYFFESRNDPDTDDVILWTHGGPGCSSSLGLFMELGPCRISDGNGTKFHQESWNSNANVFFIDHPIGVGFSYAEYGESLGTTGEAAQDIAAFVAVFFENFDKFKGRSFHMAGRAYAGQQIPVFASAVYDNNELLVKAGFTPINLKSIMIGNGLTDLYIMPASFFDMVCTPVSVPPILGIAACIRMKQATPRCMKLIKESCVDIYDEFGCQAADSFCNAEVTKPFLALNRDLLDITRGCDTAAFPSCHPVTKYISAYLNRPEVRSLIGVDPSTASDNSSCSNDFKFYLSNRDKFSPRHHYVAALLERKVRVLVYAGMNDWVGNHVGNERWTLDLEWSGKKNFSSQPLRECGLTFATIDGAGHLVPRDKPTESLELVNRWLQEQDL